jgi:hypothetical protein
LLAWNIRAGGGIRIEPIAAAVAQHDAEILVLSEYRTGLVPPGCVCGRRWHRSAIAG